MNPIKQYRKRLGMTQTEFAKFLSTSQTTVSAWERTTPPGHIVKLFEIINNLSE